MHVNRLSKFLAKNIYNCKVKYVCHTWRSVQRMNIGYLWTEQEKEWKKKGRKRILREVASGVRLAREDSGQCWGREGTTWECGGVRYWNISWGKVRRWVMREKSCDGKKGILAMFASFFHSFGSFFQSIIFSNSHRRNIRWFDSQFYYID